MEVRNRKKIRGTSMLNIINLVLVIIWAILTAILISQKNDLKRKANFEPVKQGLCVYVEQDRWYDYTYCLVYDEYIDQIIEVDIFNDVVHTQIEVGDTIIYVVDYNYCDADFLNVIKGE